MTDQPKPAEPKDGWSEGPILPRWMLWLMLPGIVAPVLVFGFIVFTQRAHDPGRCPYRDVTRRDIAAGVMVVEQMRNCVGSVEEHRYLLSRGGKQRLLGERTFDKSLFTPDNYAWQAKLDDKGEVHVVVHNEGHGDIHLREGTAAELQRDQR